MKHKPHQTLLLFLLLGSVCLSLTSARICMAGSQEETIQSLLKQAYPLYRKVRRVARCLQSHKAPLLLLCPQRRNSLEERKRCERRASLIAWRKCISLLRAAQADFEDRFKQQAAPNHARYLLVLSYMWLDYHQAMAGPPQLPPQKSFFLHNAKEQAMLANYSQAYTAHIRHIGESLRHMKRFHHVILRLMRRTSWQQALGIWKYQTHMMILEVRQTQGRFHMALMRGAIDAFSHRHQQAERQRYMEKLAKKAKQQLDNALRQFNKLRLGSATPDKRGEEQQGLKRLLREQQQMKQLIQKFRKQLQEQTSKESRPIKIKKIYLQLREETRRYDANQDIITASDAPQQIQEWQRCDVQAQQALERRSNTATGLFWAGLSTLTLGAGAAGVGTFLYVDSLDGSKHRPFEANRQQAIGVSLLVAGGITALVGGALMLSRVWVRPPQDAHHKAILRCPPQRLFPARVAALPAPNATHTTHTTHTPNAKSVPPNTPNAKNASVLARFGP